MFLKKQLGRHQHLLLGRWLRSRYNQILPETYTYYDIYVRSTDVDRTLMSAESNLAGLYPPKGNQIWDSIKWMPIPVHTVPQSQDNLLAMKKYCPRYEYELEKVKNSPEIKRIDQENAKLYSYLSQHAGRKIDSLEDLEFLYNTFYIEVCPKRKKLKFIIYNFFFRLRRSSKLYQIYEIEF